MKLLVVGPTGQLGSDLLAAATGTDDLTATPLDRSRLDLAAPDTMAAALGDEDFDVLVNCAGYTGVDAAESNAELAFTVNAYAVEALASICRARGARLVHVSTDYVFDGESETPYAEDDPAGPLNVYGASKLTGEALARRAHPEGTLVVRTSSLFGLAAARRGGGNFVETMLRLGREGSPIRVVDDIVMAPTSSVDLAGAILGLVRGGAGPGVYHYTNSGQASWHEFAAAILAGAGINAEVTAVPAAEYPAAARRPRRSVLDTRRAADLLGPAPHWRDALDRYLSDRQR